MKLAQINQSSGAVFPDGVQYGAGLEDILGNSIYAGYLLGTDYWAGTGFTPAKDISLQGRDLITRFTAGTVSGAKVVNRGSGYTSAPAVTVSGTYSTAPTFVTTINSAGQVDGIYCTGVGAGITALTLTIAAPSSGTTATATATFGAWGARGLAGSSSNYAETPFTGDQLYSRTGKASIIMLTKTYSTTAGTPVSNIANGTTSGIVGVRLSDPSSSYGVQATQRDGSTTQLSRSAFTNTTRKGYMFRAVTLANNNTQLWLTYPGSGGLETRPADTTALTNVGGPNPYFIGNHQSGSAGVSTSAMMIFCDDVVTTAQVRAVLEKVTPYFASYGLDIQT